MRSTAMTAVVAAAALLIGAGATFGKIGSRTEISRSVVNACDSASNSQCLAKVDEILRNCPQNGLTEDSTACVCTAEQQRAAQGLADAVTIVSERNPDLGVQMSRRVVEGAAECFQQVYALVADTDGPTQGCEDGGGCGPQNGSEE